MIAIIDARDEHAVWIESSLRKSQEHATFCEPLRPVHVACCDVIVATLANDQAEWLGWCAFSGDALAYVYVREAARREGVASELIATAAVRSEAARMYAATWTRGADRLATRIRYAHSARVQLEKAAKSFRPWLKNERKTA